MSPALPGGISLDAATDVVSGTPLAALSSTPFTVTMTDLAGSASASFGLSIGAAALVPVIPRPACAGLTGLERARCLATARCAKLKGAKKARCRARIKCRGVGTTRAKALCRARATCVARPAAKKRACLVRVNLRARPRAKTQSLVSSESFAVRFPAGGSAHT